MNEQNKTKCNGYEAMFTFLSEEDFQKHLEVCEECAKEHARMQRVSELIKEAKPYLKEKKKKARILRTAAGVFVIMFASLGFPAYMAGVNMYDNHIAQTSLTAQEMELPVDEYGLLYVE